MTPRERSGLAAFYRRQLLEDVIPFWERRVQDGQFGGLLHHFDRTEIGRAHV